MNDPTRILLVDDDPEIRRSNTRLLEQAGYTVIVAEDGEQAVAAAREHRPDLILLDRDMPVLDGLEACRRIKEDPALAASFVALVSGTYTSSDEQSTGLEAGADGYVVRPIGNRELLARVAAMARIQRLTQSLRVQTVQLQAEIAERKRIEAEREKLQGQLMHAQKMESVGRLAGGVAHDFNNMLGVILGYTELALDAVQPAQSLHGYLSEIRTAAERSAELTRQLLAFARKQIISPRPLDLNQSVAGTLGMLRRLIGENIELAWLPGKDLPQVKVDPSQVDQILANLCVNARDAIANTGRITIETSVVAIDETYCASRIGCTPGHYVVLAVSDNGCGMDRQTLGNIFEPFFTTKAFGQGSGLGLATVYGVVRQNRGFINVYSEPGQGTTLRIFLPAQRDATEPHGDRDETVKSPRGVRSSALVVEDEPALLKMTAMMLQRQGHTVLTASSPSEAIRLAQSHSGRIDLLLTDVVMPEMNGRDLAQQLSSRCPNLKCLFMSGYTANAIAHHGVLEAGLHFIQKPFSSADLAAKIAELQARDHGSEDAGQLRKPATTAR
ncbi:MAG: response regulator [Pirellulaceae bacterium]|nr:response regulator [Pirellulaceae bacterium]